SGVNVISHDERHVFDFRREETAAPIRQERPQLLWDFRVHELSLLSFDLHSAQPGARFDYLSAGERLISLRPASLYACSKRRGKAYAEKDRRDGAGDSRRLSNLVGKTVSKCGCAQVLPY